MKVVIPVDENTTSTSVCVSFGRAPFFMIYDSETKQYNFINNTAADSPGGAGIKAAQLIVDSDAAVLLTPRCGDNAAEVLKAGGVMLYKTSSGSAADNVSAFFSDKLAPLTETHAGFHGHQGG